MLILYSKMVPVNILQFDNLGPLQLCGSRYLGRHELAWSRRRRKASSYQRFQFSDILFDGCFLLFF